MRALVDDGDILGPRAQIWPPAGRRWRPRRPRNLFLPGRCCAEQIWARQHLVENIAEAADTIDHDIDDVVGVAHVPAPSEVPQAMMSPASA